MKQNRENKSSRSFADTSSAAQASQTPPGDPNAAPPLVVFKAAFGTGFYWFTAYCLFSLAQQLTFRWLACADPVNQSNPGLLCCRSGLTGKLTLAPFAGNFPP